MDKKMPYCYPLVSWEKKRTGCMFTVSDMSVQCCLSNELNCILGCVYLVCVLGGYGGHRVLNICQCTAMFSRGGFLFFHHGSLLHV